MKISDIYMRDPYLFVENDVGYLVGTTDKTAWSGKASGFLGYKTKDLINFEGPYELFVNDGTFWADENYWAPELHKINNKYCIIASFKSKDKNRASQILFCDKPFGKYTPSDKPFTPENWECLDATYYEENGKKYVVFCHEWTQVCDGEICVGELNESMNEVHNVKTLFKASSAHWPKSFSNNCYVTDGPFLYKLKSGRLIMIWSSSTEKGYALGMAISNGGILDEWRHIKEPLLNCDGGHGMIFSFKNELYLIIHSPNSPSLSERPIIYKIEECDDKIKIIDKY